MQKETHFVIATGGYLNEEVKCEKIELTDEDTEFLNEENGFDDFGEYATYVLEECIAEFEQGFSTVLVLSESQIEPLIQNLRKLQE
jgi:hypothetical protein